MIGHPHGMSIFCGIGERCREGEELYRGMKAAGVLNNMVTVYGEMNERPGSRFRVGAEALASENASPLAAMQRTASHSPGIN